VRAGREVRITLTLDDDVAAKLEAEARRAGRPFREIVNETLRQGLLARHDYVGREPFKINPRDLGRIRPGVKLDKVSALLEQIDGPIPGV
jgi:hypothetical protein